MHWTTTLPQLLLTATLFQSTGCDKTRHLADRIGITQPAGTSTSGNPWVIRLTDQLFPAFSRQKDRVVIVNYQLDWLETSVAMTELLEQISQQYEGAVWVGNLNVDAFRQFSTEQKVVDVPDIRVYRNGRQVEKFNGTSDESEIWKSVAKHAKSLPKPKVIPEQITKSQTKDALPPGVSRR